MRVPAVPPNIATPSYNPPIAAVPPLAFATIMAASTLGRFDPAIDQHRHHQGNVEPGEHVRDIVQLRLLGNFPESCQSIGSPQIGAE